MANILVFYGSSAQVQPALISPAPRSSSRCFFCCRVYDFVIARTFLQAAETKRQQAQKT
jgi:hypothetical protein